MLRPSPELIVPVTSVYPSVVKEVIRALGSMRIDFVLLRVNETGGVGRGPPITSN